MKFSRLVPMTLILQCMLFPVLAASPQQIFKGRILLSDKRFPTVAKNPDAYTAALRRQAKTSFAENKENKSWKMYFAAFLKTPLADNAYKVSIYDETGNGKKLIVTLGQFADARGLDTVISEILLERKQVGVNKNLLMCIEDGSKRVLASAKFKILGEGGKYSGKVEFKDE